MSKSYIFHRCGIGPTNGQAFPGFCPTSWLLDDKKMEIVRLIMSQSNADNIFKFNHTKHGRGTCTAHHLSSHSCRASYWFGSQWNLHSLFASADFNKTSFLVIILIYNFITFKEIKCNFIIFLGKGCLLVLPL